jgi:hypothetical protein
MTIKIKKQKEGTMRDNTWKTLCTKKANREYFPRDIQEFMRVYGTKLRTACVSETMGPNWKDLIVITMSNGMKLYKVFK